MQREKRGQQTALEDVAIAAGVFAAAAAAMTETQGIVSVSIQLRIKYNTHTMHIYIQPIRLEKAFSETVSKAQS